MARQHGVKVIGTIGDNTHYKIGKDCVSAVVWTGTEFYQTQLLKTPERA